MHPEKKKNVFGTHYLPGTRVPQSHLPTYLPDSSQSSFSNMKIQLRSFTFFDASLFSIG